MTCIDDGILRARLDGELPEQNWQRSISTSPRAPIATRVSKS